MRRREVTSPTAIGDEEGKAAQTKKNRPRRGKQERDEEDRDPQAQRSQRVRPVMTASRQGSVGLGVGLTLTEGLESTTTATKPMRGYTGVRST
jgi:hypothetical protein